jgi:hypothetical protein
MFRCCDGKEGYLVGCNLEALRISYVHLPHMGVGLLPEINVLSEISRVADALGITS